MDANDARPLTIRGHSIRPWLGVAAIGCFGGTLASIEAPQVRFIVVLVCVLAPTLLYVSLPRIIRLPRRSWIQFRLISLLGLLTIVGVGLKWLAPYYGYGQLVKAVSTFQGSSKTKPIHHSLPFLRTVTSIWVYGTTDADVVRLVNLPGANHVKDVSIYQCHLTEAGIASLTGFEDCENLFLWNVDVTDQGLNQLGRMGKLKYVLLINTETTSAGVDRFQRQYHIRTIRSDHPDKSRVWGVSSTYTGAPLSENLPHPRALPSPE